MPILSPGYRLLWTYKKGARSVKILIVDDSKAMRMIVMRQLRQAGYEDAEFSEAANGYEGHRRNSYSCR